MTENESCTNYVPVANRDNRNEWSKICLSFILHLESFRSYSKMKNIGAGPSDSFDNVNFFEFLHRCLGMTLLGIRKMAFHFISILFVLRVHFCFSHHFLVLCLLRISCGMAHTNRITHAPHKPLSKYIETPNGEYSMLYYTVCIGILCACACTQQQRSWKKKKERLVCCHMT